MEQKFYKCEICGNIIAYVNNSGVPVMCCGQKMTEIIPGTTDGAVEKHVPVYEVKDNKVDVKVGSVEHPMLPEHYIQWIEVHTENKIYRKYLKPGEKPEATFKLDEKLVMAREYCNLHGLWKK